MSGIALTYQAEGLSYVSSRPYIEQSEKDLKTYRASNLLNYLDFSIDLDLGDLFNSKAMGDRWLGQQYPSSVRNF